MVTFMQALQSLLVHAFISSVHQTEPLRTSCWLLCSLKARPSLRTPLKTLKFPTSLISSMQSVEKFPEPAHIQIVIDGVKQSDLHGAGRRPRFPDRCEAGTFMFAVMATGGDITIDGVNPHHLYSVINKCSEMGAEISIFAPDTIKVKAASRMRATDVTTVPYPGFPTDLQAPLMSVLAAAEGTSIITETIYEKSLHASCASFAEWVQILFLLVTRLLSKACQS